MEIFESSNFIFNASEKLKTLSETIANLNSGQSIALSFFDLPMDTVGILCSALSDESEKFRYVIFKHETIYEIACVDKTPESAAFQSLLNHWGNQESESKSEHNKIRSLSGDDIEILQACKEKILDVLNDYLSKSFDDIVKTHAQTSFEMFSENIIALSYIQRRVAAVSCFRKYSGGTTKAIYSTLEHLEEGGYIKLIEPLNQSKSFKSYKIIKTH